MNKSGILRNLKTETNRNLENAWVRPEGNETGGSSSQLNSVNSEAVSIEFHDHSIYLNLPVGFGNGLAEIWVDLLL